MLSNLEYVALLGKSDHSVLCFQLNCYVKSDPYTSRHRNYNNHLLRADLRVDWHSLLNPLHGDAEAQFMVF